MLLRLPRPWQVQLLAWSRQAGACIDPLSAAVQVHVRRTLLPGHHGHPARALQGLWEAH